MILYVVRHGQTQYNVDKRFQGQIDVPLNDVGKKQVMELSKKLSNINLDLIISSPLLRAVDTAKAIQKNNKVPIIISEKNNLLFFYVHANNIIYWLNFLNIKEYYKYNNNLMVVFNNEFNLTLNISYSVFHNQILKCSRLLVIYNSR